MSLLSKILGRKSFEEELAAAHTLLAEGDLGRAKLAFERALERGGERPTEERTAVRAKIGECCDGIARRRLEEARRLLRDRELDLALEEFEGAAETAASSALREEIETAAQQAVREDARSQLGVVEQSAEERLETLGGHWEEEQHEEYAEYGADLGAALLAAADGQTAAALAPLEELLATAKHPRYLFYEVGRVRLLEGDTQGGREALCTFLERMTEGEGGEARLSAHIELAALHHADGDFDSAVAQYDAAIEALPEDPRPYLALAAFLRREGHAAEAVEVLQSAVALGDSDKPHWLLSEQLGLAHADLDHAEQATELLEDVVGQLVARNHVDLPPEGTMRLCQLHERHGNPARAVDLLCVLAKGSDTKNRFVYQLEAARVMHDLGLQRDARLMLERAAECVPDSDAARERLARVGAAIKENAGVS